MNNKKEKVNKDGFKTVKSMILNYSIAIFTFVILILIFSQTKGKPLSNTESNIIASEQKETITMNIDKNANKEEEFKLTKTKPINIFKTKKKSSNNSINKKANEQLATEESNKLLIKKIEKVELSVGKPEDHKAKTDNKVFTEENTKTTSPTMLAELETKMVISTKGNTQKALLKKNPNIYSYSSELNNKSENKTSNVKTIDYVVKAGDYLNGIAVKYKVTIYKLISYNTSIKNPNLIYIGQVIKIPNELLKRTNAIKGKAFDKAHNISKYGFRKYIIKKGDTLGNIAKKFNLAIYDLYKYNYIKNPNHILIGDYLKIVDYPNNIKKQLLN